MTVDPKFAGTIYENPYYGLNTTEPMVYDAFSNTISLNGVSGIVSTVEPASNSTIPSSLAVKNYVDSFIQQQGWEPYIQSVYDPTGGLPSTPNDLDRYISSATANGWTINNIYEYDSLSSTWTPYVPQTGWSLWDKNTNTILVFSANQWAATQGGTSATAFIQLTDTPHSYTTADSIYKVNSTRTGVVESSVCIDNTDPNASKLKVISPDGSKLTQIACDQLWNIAQMYTSCNSIVFWVASTKVATIGQDGVLTLWKSGSIGTVLTPDTSNRLNVSDVMVTNGSVNTTVGRVDQDLKTTASPTFSALRLYWSTPTNYKSIFYDSNNLDMRSFIGGVRSRDLHVYDNASNFSGWFKIDPTNANILISSDYSATSTTYINNNVQASKNLTVGVVGGTNTGTITLDNGTASQTISLNSGTNKINFDDTQFNYAPTCNGITYFKPSSLYSASTSLTTGTGYLTTTADGINLNTTNEVAIGNNLVVNSTVTAGSGAGSIKSMGGIYATDNVYAVNGVRGSDITTPTVTGGLNNFYTSTQNKVNSIVSVKDFNAFGNGVHDDTSAFVNFFTFLASAPNQGCGYIPTGVYKITTSISVDLSAVVGYGITLFGDGLSNSILNFDSGCSLTFTSGTPSYYVTMRDFGVSGLINGYLLIFSQMIRDSQLTRLKITNTSGATGCGAVSLYYAVSLIMDEIICQGNNSASTNAGIYVGSATGLQTIGGYISSFGTGIILNANCTGNLFQTVDIEYCNVCVKVVASSNRDNLFTSGLFYSFAVGCINCIAGTSTVFYYPNIGSGTKYINTVGLVVYSSYAQLGTLTSLPPSVQISNLFLGASTDALTNYSTINTTLTWSLSLSNTFVVRCCKIGSTVTISSNKYTGTSNGTSTYLLSTTGINSAYYPAVEVRQPIWTLNNTANICGLLIISTAGIITIYRDISNIGTNFQNNTTIGYSFSVSYNN